MFFLKFFTDWTTMTIEGKAKMGATYLAYEDATSRTKYNTLITFAKEENGPGKTFIADVSKCPTGTCTTPDSVQASASGEITPKIIALPAKIGVNLADFNNFISTN